MNSLYTPEVRRMVHEYGIPNTITWEVVEYDHHLNLRFFRQNIDKQDAEVKLRFARVLQDLLTAVNKSGVPMNVEVVKGERP